MSPSHSSPSRHGDTVLSDSACPHWHASASDPGPRAAGGRPGAGGGHRNLSRSQIQVCLRGTFAVVCLIERTTAVNADDNLNPASVGVTVTVDHAFT